MKTEYFEFLCSITFQFIYEKIENRASKTANILYLNKTFKRSKIDNINYSATREQLP